MKAANKSYNNMESIEVISLIDPKHECFSQEEWSEYLSEPPEDLTENRRLEESVISGIPSEFRGRFWSLLCNKVDRPANEIFLRFSEVANPEIDALIFKDLDRTFSSQEPFKSNKDYYRTGLLRVLRAYGNFDREIGYCQGMSFIVGVLLTSIPDYPGVFKGFYYIMCNLNWREMFLQGTPRFIWTRDTIRRQIEANMLGLSKHFNRENLEIDCLIRYIFTVFSYNTPIDFAKRMMDLFLFKGECVLMDVLLKMLELKKQYLLSLRFEDLHNYLSHTIVEDCFAQYHMTTLLSPLIKYNEI